jgi:hypothetical protein
MANTGILPHSTSLRVRMTTVTYLLQRAYGKLVVEGVDDGAVRGEIDLEGVQEP